MKLGQKNSIWKIGDGCSAAIWTDNWLFNNLIGEFFSNISFNPNDRVNAYISEGSWIFPPAFNLEVQMFLKNCCGQPPILFSSPDQLYWAATNSGLLPLKTVWDAIRSRGLNQPWAPLVWSSLMLPKISCFSWKLFHGRLPTSNFSS